MNDLTTIDKKITIMNDLTTIDKKLVIMETAGATRKRSWEAVAEALSAMKMTVDKHGEEHMEEDHATRLRAAEIIARATGDIKPDGAITNNVVTIGITAAEFRDLLNSAKQSKDVGQTGEIIDVVNYRA